MRPAYGPTPTRPRGSSPRRASGALAVAVGSSHAMTERVAAIDHELVARLARAVPVPLVLHGSSGVPDESIVRGIRAGLTKINVSTHLNARFTAAIREYLTANPAVVDSRTYVAAGRDAVRHEAARLLTLFASAATESVDSIEAWQAAVPAAHARKRGRMVRWRVGWPSPPSAFSCWDARRPSRPIRWSRRRIRPGLRRRA